MYVLTDESPGELLRIAPADEAMKTYELIGSAGCGSAIAEMALALANAVHAGRRALPEAGPARACCASAGPGADAW